MAVIETGLGVTLRGRGSRVGRGWDEISWRNLQRTIYLDIEISKNDKSSGRGGRPGAKVGKKGVVVWVGRQRARQGSE